MGGAVSTIAGPGAGMAAAMDIQAETARENAHIRVHLPIFVKLTKMG